MLISFSAPVDFLQFAHPVASVTDMGGGLTWQINFSPQEMFTNQA